MRLRMIGLAVAVALTVSPTGALGHPGRASTHADHIAEDTAPHDRTAESQLTRRTRVATAADALAAAAAVAGNEAEVGSWGPVQNWQVVGVHVALLPNGKVLAYDSVGDGATESFPDHNFTRAIVWDPATGTQTPANVNTGFNVFCSGLAHLTDGTLFLAGGNRSSALDGIIQTHVFNYVNNTWSLGPNMAAGRWYPTVTPLRNGEMLITEGGPNIPEVRTTAGGLRRLTSASLNLPLYPWIDVAPDGRAFYSGPDQTMRALDANGTGTWTAFAQRDAFNRDYGSHAVYDIGKILVAGGAGSRSDAMTIDVNNIDDAPPSVDPTAPMANGRRQHNLTVLADGKVLATGGNSNGAGLVDLDFGVYAAELWDPATGTWTTLAAEQVTRQYHSTALLLPDGRVLSSGGGICGTCDDVGYLAKNAQVFTPPYLFKNDGSGELAPRPAIAAAPAGVAYGAGFQIDTPNAAAIRKVALVRLGAVTHSVNMEQRYVPLTFTAGTGALTANAPDDANIAPPGVYMLFVVDAAGVPSVARMVNVGAAAPGDTAPPSAPSSLTATAAGSSQVNLSWTAATDNVGVTGYRVERCQGAGCTNFTEVASPPGTTYSDTGRSASTTYRYRVRAADAAGNLGGYSPEAQATTSAAPATPQGLVGAWAFSEGSGSTTADASGNGNVGTITNATWSTQGRYGNALSFNGTSSVVRVPSAASLNVSSAMTLSAWIRPTASQTGWRTIIQRQADAYFLSSSNDQPMRPAGGATINGGVRFLSGPTANPLNTWTHVALTFDGNQLRLYVNGTLVANRGANGTVQTVANPLWIGGNQPYGEYFQGLIDEVRVYNRALTAADIQADMNTSIAPTAPDTTAPSTPSGLNATAVSATQINLSWTASTDNVGVTEYRVERCAGATCTVFTQVANPTGTTFNDTGRSPSTTYRYQVRAVDQAGNFSPYSTIASATTPGAPDTTPPSAAVTAPAAGTVVSGNVTVSAGATDNVGVVGVQFLLDGASLGAEDTTAPYSITWDTTSASNGVHTLQARARDAAGNSATSSSSVTVTVSNAAPPPPAGLLAGWGFNESLGSTVNDVTGHGNTATLQDAPTWTAGKYGGGLRFDGVNDYLTVLNSPSLNFSGTEMTLSMWINPLGGIGDQVPFAKFWSGTMASPFYQYGLELGGGSTPNFYVGTAGGLVGASMGSPLTLGQWSHLAIVFTGSQARFYVNGNLVSSPSMSASISARDSLLYMSADVRPSQFFNGTLDDVRLYNRAQSQTEVQTDMNAALSTPVFDPTAPTVSITSPANDAIVSGNRTITADAADDVGVAGVQFYVDGNPLGPEDTAPPYGANWDTRVIPNGAHTLTARARDTDNKTTLSALVNVTVANSDHFQNQVLATGFDLPTNIEFLPDGRMLVAELGGKIKVLAPPYTTPDPTLFLQITNIVAGGVQQGIFDIALDPDFATNHYYYVFYTLGTPTVDRLSRFTANAGLTGTVPGSELVLYQDPGTAFIEHHGGAVNFGNDGKLYFTTGDHFAGTPSQELFSPRGKIHRIDKDGFVPLDNPFYDGAGSNWDSVWAYGLRNPFRAYFDAPTNRLYVADVGGNVQSTANEELNVGARGANYGWPDSEGPCSAPCTSPLYDYEHNGQSASITGGFVYHGTQFPSSMHGNYFFADYARRWIKRLTFDTNGNVSGVFNFEPISGNPNESAGDIVYLTEGPDGALYYLDLGYSDVTETFGVSKLRRIRYVQSNQAPVALVSANPTSGPRPLAVTFSSAGSNDPEGQPITYSWDFGDGTSSTASNPVHTYTDAGQYLVRLTVSDGVNSSISTPLSISVGNLPTARIDSPAAGATFRAGDVISYGGDATDAEDGTLPASAFTWTVDFLHDTHVHPVIQTTGVKSGTFTIPTSGHDFQGNTRYRITLTVMDSDGLRDTRSVIVTPQKVNLAFDTVPSGLTLHVDGVARPAPFVLDTLVGFQHTIEARNQTLGSNAYTFSAWSDGGAQAHTITAPIAGQSYTATYTTAGPPSGLAGAWGFNEGTGTTTADSSGNGNTATLVNGPTRVVGKFGNGLSFDGANDNLTVANSTSLNISGSALTLSMWINPVTITGDSVVLGKFWNAGMTSPYYHYGLELSGGRPHLYIGTATGLVGAFMDTALAANQWSHLAIVFNGSQAQFYVNGTLVSTKALNATLTARGQLLRVGADASPSQFYRGALDNLRIYNRTLSALEVQSDMNTAVGSGG